MTKCYLKEEYDFAFYDGDRVGYRRDDGTVEPKTCPKWFQAVTEVMKDHAAARIKANKDGAVTTTDDGVMFVPCSVNRCVHEVRANHYILRRSTGELRIYSEEKFANKCSTCK